MDFGRIANKSDANRFAAFFCSRDDFERVIEIERNLVAISCLEPLANARFVHLDAKERRARHLRGKWLRAAHATEACGENEFSRQRSVEMFVATRHKCFERPL